MLGVGDVHVTRPLGDRITQVMKPSHHGAETIGAPAAVRALPTLVVATPLDDLGLRQILDTRDPFRHIADVPSWPSHGDILHESAPRKLSANTALDQQEYSVLMLQSQQGYGLIYRH